jgi:hypothetical protein
VGAPLGNPRGASGRPCVRLHVEPIVELTWAGEEQAALVALAVD